MTPERWLPVPGYRNLYEVSDRGRVRSLPRNTTRGKILAPCLHRRRGGEPGQLVVRLSRRGDKSNWAIHRLVLLAFVGRCPQGMQARHFPDRDVTNNRLVNLSWSTPLVNQRDRDIHGTHNKGVRNTWAKLDNAAVRKIRAVKAWPYGSLTAMARHYNVSRTVIAYVRNRKSWRHVK